jgi:hypothetical protein
LMYISVIVIHDDNYFLWYMGNKVVILTHLSEAQKPMKIYGNFEGAYSLIK